MFQLSSPMWKMAWPSPMSKARRLASGSAAVELIPPVGGGRAPLATLGRRTRCVEVSSCARRLSLGRLFRVDGVDCGLCLTAVLRQAVLTAFCHALSTRARKDEWTASFEGDTFVRRGNFNWVDENGNHLPNTSATVASRKNGDLLRGRSAPSKCGRGLNVEWGARDMWFRYDDHNPLNFASLAPMRGSTPLPASE